MLNKYKKTFLLFMSTVIMVSLFYVPAVGSEPNTERYAVESETDKDTETVQDFEETESSKDESGEGNTESALNIDSKENTDLELDETVTEPMETISSEEEIVGTASLEKQEETAEVYAAGASVAYQVYAQTYGWMDWVNNGAMGGTTGAEKRLEAFRVQIKQPDVSGNVEYRVHAQTYGWMDWKKDGEFAGTTGQAKRLEAVQIRLTGQMAEKYDIYYRLYVQSFGWLGWAKNGEGAGTEGYAKRAEAIEIVLVPKGTSAPGSTLNAYITDLRVEYQTHVQTYGWTGLVSNGVLSGTTGEAKRLEAIRVSLKNHGLIPGDINYRVHCQTYGWMDWKKNGEMAGTSGEAKRLEAIQISLSGEMQNQYDIYYRVHCQTFGWTGWAVNGESCGSEGYAKRLEAIEIQLVKKGGAAPGSRSNCFYKYVAPASSYKDATWGIDVSAHQATINWSKVKADGVDFAMLRVTKKNTDSTSSATLMEDPYFDKNAQGALANGIPIGAYVYVYASTPAEAKAEAELAVSIMKGYKITYPIAFDLEEPEHMTTAAKLNNMAMMKAFCDVISAAGYKTMVYGSASKLKGDIYDYKQVIASHDIWIARYRWGYDAMPFNDAATRQMVYEKGYEGGNYTGFSRVTMWQYTASGTVNGIKGSVDCNIGYKKY